MGTYAGGNSRRPIGDAGRGRHTGKVGWLGGQHRRNDGCLATLIVMVGVVAGVATGIGYAVSQIFI